MIQDHQRSQLVSIMVTFIMCTFKYLDMRGPNNQGCTPIAMHDFTHCTTNAHMSNLSFAFITNRVKRQSSNISTGHASSGVGA